MEDRKIDTTSHHTIKTTEHVSTSNNLQKGKQLQPRLFLFVLEHPLHTSTISKMMESTTSSFARSNKHQQVPALQILNKSNDTRHRKFFRFSLQICLHECRFGRFALPLQYSLMCCMVQVHGKLQIARFSLSTNKTFCGWRPQTRRISTAAPESYSRRQHEVFHSSRSDPWYWKHSAHRDC